ncbi:hypothetical protein PybrP1_009945 [[Pythium] brassicae (nom. inval.)]|nr:hypothetical protein PybrP1_009945 [[Pythium] brassicae (nom. inval.)]
MRVHLPASVTAPEAHEAAPMHPRQAKRLRRQTPEQRVAAEFRRKVEKCASSADARGALALYAQIKAEGVALGAYVFRVIINVCVKAEAEIEFKDGAFQVYEDMKADAAASKGIDESIYTALVKLCSKHGDFARGHALIAELEEQQVAPKLRTLAPMLRAYSDAGDMSNCLAMQRTIARHDLELTEPEFVALLSVCSATGDAAQFYATLDEYIDAVEQPSLAGWAVFKDWFSSAAARVDDRTWTYATGTVDAAGVCSVTGKQLQSIELAPAQEAELLAKTDERRTAQWAAFKAWLDERGPFDVVIDAANVGYFNQNFDGYLQIEEMRTHYTKQGKRVLMLLHKRRTLDEQVPEEHRAMVARWAASGEMYNCEAGNNDDWYWLYAAVKLGGRTLAVTNDEMRDHHFQMIHNRAFVRWKERHRARYSAGAEQPWAVAEPAAFSARPQRSRDGEAWHFPPAAPGSETWLCFVLEQAPVE